MPNNFERFESIAEKLEKFWILYPAGKISSEIVYQDGQRYIVRSDLYRDINDLIPFATYSEVIYKAHAGASNGSRRHSKES